MSSDSKKRMYGELLSLFNERMPQHKDYFLSNTLIHTSYQFCKKIIDKIAEIE